MTTIIHYLTTKAMLYLPLFQWEMTLNSIHKLILLAFYGIFDVVKNNFICLHSEKI